MSFVLEKITTEDLLSKYPEKYSVLKDHFPDRESLGFPLERWIVDRDREIYVFLMNCGEVRDPEVYVILFCHENFVLMKVEDNSFFHWGGGKGGAEILYLPEEIRDKVELLQTIINQAFNEGEWFGPNNSRALAPPELFLSFRKIT